jgi:hypothetical protein
MAGPPPPQATPPPGLPASRCRWKTELVTADFQTTCLALDLVTEMAPAPASSPSLHRPGGSQRPVAICETGTATCWRPSSMGNACRVGPTPHVADYAEARPINAGDGLWAPCCTLRTKGVFGTAPLPIFQLCSILYLPNTPNSSSSTPKKLWSWGKTPPIWWSNKTGTPQISQTKVLMEFGGNYPPMPLVTQKRFDLFCFVLLSRDSHERTSPLFSHRASCLSSPSRAWNPSRRPWMTIWSSPATSKPKKWRDLSTL